ncbi:MAG: FAD:protein FMN transferase [Bacilli bacterium]|nr:FAD:protein FMN transferase [Bacilli bacterium]
MKKIKTIILVLIFMCLIGCSSKHNLNEYTKSINYFDTDINLKIYTHDINEANQIFDGIEEIYSSYSEIVDRDNPDSEISYIYNNKLQNNKIKLSKKMTQLIEYGINLYTESNGLLSINTGNLIDTWNDSYLKKELPNQQLLNNIDTTINNVKINNNMLENNHNNLSFNQFIRGYTHQLVKAYLEKNHIDYYFVNTSTEVLAGKNISGNNYVVLLSNPFNDGVLKNINMQNKFLVTKSIYHNSYEYDDDMYSNIVNAKEKKMANGMVSVTVLSDSPDTGDMVANMLFLLNYEDGLKIAKKYGVEAIWCYYDKNNNEIIKMTDNM